MNFFRENDSYNPDSFMLSYKYIGGHQEVVFLFHINN
jgi:hypothetical protein